MGWTSKQYVGDETHTTLTEQEVKALIEKEYLGYTVLDIHLVQAEDEYLENVAYTLMQTPNGDGFVVVFLIRIEDGLIYWKYIPETNGPAYYDCPERIYNKALAENDLAIAWRTQCKANEKA